MHLVTSVQQGEWTPFGRARITLGQISSRRVFLRNTISGISDSICNENYYTDVTENVRCVVIFVARIVFLRNTTQDEIPSTERRVVGIRWEHLKPQGPEGQKIFHFFDVRTLGETPTQPHFFPFMLGILTDFTPHPPTIPFILWGIRD